MFETESVWEDECDADKSLHVSLSKCKPSNKNKCADKCSNDKIYEQSNLKKRKRGKKRKKQSNGSVADESADTCNLNKTKNIEKITFIDTKQEEGHGNSPLVHSVESTKKKLKLFRDDSEEKLTLFPNKTKDKMRLFPYDPSNSLKQKLLSSLESSRFRFINEQLYTKHSSDAAKMFKEDPKSFEVYHNGYQAQIKKWDVDPLQMILTWIKKKPSKLVIADFGCGEAWIAQKVKNKVHSFDLVALNDHVTVADISKVPLENESVDIVILCLALMGTNLNEIIFEANRVLKNKGMLKVAEVASRFQGSVTSFVRAMKKFGFAVLKRNLNHTHFYMFDFQKKEDAKESILDNSYPGLQLKPCLYKKR